MPYSHRKFYFQHYCRMMKTRVEEWKLGRKGEYSQYKSQSSVDKFIRNTSKKTFGFDKERNLEFDYGNLDRYLFKYFQPVGGKLTLFGKKLWEFHDWNMSHMGSRANSKFWIEHQMSKKYAKKHQNSAGKEAVKKEYRGWF